MKNKLILFCWIAGLLLTICVFWISTTNVQSKYLLRTINNVFINNDDSRRLHEYIPVKTGIADLMGYWYSFYDSENLFFVFTFFNDGILLPLGAIVSPQGNVSEIIPLSSHSAQVFENIPQSILELYKKRIENSIQNRRKE